MDGGEYDLYGDLDDFSLNEQVKEKSALATDLTEKLRSAEETITKLNEQIQSLVAEKATLVTNISSLMKTARAEIARKNNQIEDLRSKNNDICFRRVDRQPQHRPTQSTQTMTDLSFKPSQKVENNDLTSSIKIESSRERRADSKEQQRTKSNPFAPRSASNHQINNNNNRRDSFNHQERHNERKRSSRHVDVPKRSDDQNHSSKRKRSRDRADGSRDRSRDRKRSNRSDDTHSNRRTKVKDDEIHGMDPQEMDRSRRGHREKDRRNDETLSSDSKRRCDTESIANESHRHRKSNAKSIVPLAIPESDNSHVNNVVKSTPTVLTEEIPKQDLMANHAETLEESPKAEALNQVSLPECIALHEVTNETVTVEPKQMPNKCVAPDYSPVKMNVETAAPTETEGVNESLEEGELESDSVKIADDPVQPANDVNDNNETSIRCDENKCETHAKPSPNTSQSKSVKFVSTKSTDYRIIEDENEEVVIYVTRKKTKKNPKIKKQKKSEKS